MNGATVTITWNYNCMKHLIFPCSDLLQDPSLTAEYTHVRGRRIDYGFNRTGICVELSTDFN